ncbi:MAG: hypothetical protein VXY89_07145 [SAR324 cluster bacterium]|nr:hypothetical protein [SAR324 cluster bacterium]
MPQSQPHQRYSSPKSPRKRQLWANRYRRLKDWVNSLPPLLILRAEKLIQVFLRRKSLHLRLADNYLIELWGHISRATVQRTLKQLERLGLLKRITGPPKRQGDGSWKQDRKLILLLPKKDPSEHSYLVSHSVQQLKLQGNPVGKNSTQSVKQRDFVDYLCEQQRVSKGSWAHWLRKNEAASQTFGYLLGSIHQRIQNRPDVLENILFDGLEQKLRGKQLVGYTIAEIKARIPA